MKLKSFFLSLFFFLFVGCTSYYHGPTKDNYDGQHFFHKWGQDEKSFLTLLKWQMTSDKKVWPEYKSVATQKIPDLQKNESQVSVTFINHASVYIQAYGLRMITDPQWSDRASPVSFAGPKRVSNAGVEIDQLPGLDLVLLSHNHYDHFDLPTLKKLKQLYDPTFYIPLGDGYLMKEAQIEKYVELDWWAPIQLSKNVEMTFVPVKHWSARGLWDRNKSLWGGYVLQNKNVSEPFRIFFAGDTGYCSIFKELNEKYGDFDLSLLPIGAYEPRWFMKDAHMNPEEAVQAHKDLKSKYSLGIHWGLWQLTDESQSDPLDELQTALKKLSVSTTSFETYQLGQTRLLK